MSTDVKNQTEQENEQEQAEEQATGELQAACDAAMNCFREYAKERPESVALWALGVGFVLGWKLKPW